LDPIAVKILNTYIIIPVFNHDEHLRRVILELQKKGFTKIIVVDDGSTKDVFTNISDLNIHFLRHKINLGQGAALQTGFEFAKKNMANYVVSFDADGQHSAADAETVLEPVLNGSADLVLGSRFLSQNSQNVPSTRKRVLKLATFVNYLFANIKLTDAHNGLRALNAPALEKLKITENRMAHATEILIEARKHSLRITEVPVTIHYTDYSMKHGQSSWNSLRILIDLLLYKLFA
jgi:glycosyltransferase involved in cell wall biosynthesis